MIPREKIDEIREKSDIIKVISEYVALKKRGRNYLPASALSIPKRTPRSPSRPEKQLFHCFGCGEGGQCFRFSDEDREHRLCRSGAELGSQVGVAVESRGARPDSKTDKDKLYEVLALAGKFFVSNLAAGRATI